MRVLIVLDAFSLGGAEKQALLFAEWLQNKKGDTVEIWAFMPGDGSAKMVCERYNLKTKVIGYFRGLARFLYPKQIWEYAKLFNEFKPDVVLGYTNQPNLLLGLVWKKTKAKYFIWGQQGIDPAGYAFSKRSDQLALQNTPVFISNSTNGAVFLREKLGIPSEKVMVVYNGPEIVPAEFTPQEWRKKLGLKPENIVVLMVAHFANRKDHDTMLAAWKIVVDTLLPKGKEPILLLAGIWDHTTIEHVGRTLKDGTFPYVKFLGNVRDITGLNQIADLHVLSSIIEGLPNSLLEAMRLGVPVVATDIAGIREALGDENDECLSKPKSPSDLAEKIIRVLENPEVAKQISQRNTERINKHFNLEQMCNIHYDLMKKHTGK